MKAWLRNEVSVAKPRIYELAKEFGLDNKTLIQILKDMGEFVKSASSTVEPPVVRRLREQFPTNAGSTSEADSQSTKSRVSKKKAASSTADNIALVNEGAENGISLEDSEVSQRSGAEDISSGAKSIYEAEEQDDDYGGSSKGARRSSRGTKEGSRHKIESNLSNMGAQDGELAGMYAAGATRNKASNKVSDISSTSSGTAHASGASTRGALSAASKRSGLSPKGFSDTLRQSSSERDSVGGGAKSSSRSSMGADQGLGGARGFNAGKAHSKMGIPRPGNSPFVSRQGMALPTPSNIPRPYKGSGTGNNAPGKGGGRSRGGGRGQWDSSRSRDSRSIAIPAWQGGVDVPDMGPMPPRGGGNGRGSRWNVGGPASGSGGRGGRGSGRGNTAGAFGNQGSRSSRARKNRREKTQEYQDMVAPVIGGVRIPKGDGTIIRLPQGATLADLAEKIHVSAASLVTVLFNMGEMVTATQSLDSDTFQLLGEEIGWNIEIVSAEEEDRQLLEQFDIDLDNEQLQDDKDLVPRPPVVTVMGHVDHGKTQLLDTIRQTNVLAGEAGGITQRIGAYMVTTDLNGQKREITFLDTPGHEAFTAMRARGVEITDVAVLVVAANDGVMPQTVEAINHAQAASVPIVVAVNKIDLPDANPQKVRAQLMEFGLVAEEFGGDTIFVDISAKKNQNIDQLLDAILLTADADLDLRANPDQPARGATIEARLDKGRGAMASVLVQQGTLRIGDSIVVGDAYGHVRAMFDEYGQRMEEAGPSTPVGVLGLASVPSAGDLLIVTPDERSARQIAEKREAVQRAAVLSKRHKKVVTLEALQEQFKKSEINMLNLVIKSDSSGSVEALEDELMKIDVSSEVGIDVIHRGVGAITQNDVNLAAVDKAVIIGFNVRPNRSVAELAEREGVEIRFYTVIYKAVEDIQAALEGLLKPVYEEKVTSHSEVRQIFRSSKFGNIAGSMVLDGIVKRGSKARITRDGIVAVNDLEITSLRHYTDDVNEIKAGFEAGINLGSYNDIQVGDIIETYEMQEIERTKSSSDSKSSSKKEESSSRATRTGDGAENMSPEENESDKNSSSTKSSTKKIRSKKSSKEAVEDMSDDELESSQSKKGTQSKKSTKKTTKKTA